MSFTVWVDADACPKAVKEVLFRMAERRRTPVVLVANQYLPTPRSGFVRAMQVEAGFDKADDAIVARLAPGDLVITSDVPLANEVIEKGGSALSPRGMLYTAENIRDHLQRRDMREELRSSGLVSGGPPALEKKDVQQFANALDRYLTRALGPP